MDINDVSGQVVDAAIKVHSVLGPGLLEHAHEACLSAELITRGLTIERQKPLPVIYKGQRLDCGYRIDLMVEGAVIVEVKAVEHLGAVHSAQLLSYLRFAACQVGLLFNFNVKWLTDQGLKRVVNGFQE